MFVVRSIINDKYLDENGDLTSNMDEARRFETKDDATNYVISIHMMDPEYIERVPEWSKGSGF